MTDSDTAAQETRARVSMSGPDKIEITGLTREEVELIEGAIRSGAYWISQCGGRISARSAFEKLPGPAEDEDMRPFWRRPVADERESTGLLFDIEGGLPKHGMPSFWIQSLCGHYYTPERYDEAAQTLTSFGFECLRSQRGRDGCFWEVWYLPGFFAADGKLKEFITGHGYDRRDRLDREDIFRIGVFIFERAPFGTLEVTTQRLAMGPPGD